jgi:hypothetical protein
MDQRGYLADVVDVWRNHFTVALGRTAWNRLALLLADTMSGFNAFCRNAVQIYKTDADASFASNIAAIAAYKAEVVMLNLDDGATGDESGNFEIWYGTSPNSLLLLESTAIVGGKVTTGAALSTAAEVVYLKLRKGGFDRSGIFQITTKLS